MAVIQVGINRSIGEHQRAHLPLRIRFSIEADRTRQATSGLPSSPALSRQSKAMKIEFSTTVRVFMRSQLISDRLSTFLSPLRISRSSGFVFTGTRFFPGERRKGGPRPRRQTPHALQRRIGSLGFRRNLRFDNCIVSKRYGEEHGSRHIALVVRCTNPGDYSSLVILRTLRRRVGPG
jgi:hypothetical protein